MAEKLILYNPVGGIMGEEKSIAHRPADLTGKIVGLLDNGKEFSDIIVRRAGELLEKKFNLKKVVLFEKGFPSKPAPFLDKMVKECDAVINGVGH